MMHPALWQLVWFDIRGGIRAWGNIRRNWRQLALLLLMLGFVGIFVGARMVNPSDMAGSRFGSAMPFWALLYLLANWLTGSADRGLIMRPAEIHFVVGGPFRDRDIITLSLIKLALRSLISAAVLGLLATAYVASYPSALVGLWLMIVVSLLVGMIASLSARSAHGKVVQMLRRIFTIAVIGMLLALVAQSMQAVRASGQAPHISLIAAAASSTELGQYLMPPLAWMFAPLSASSFYPDVVQMLPMRGLVLACLVGCVLGLGRRYSEASMNRTEKSMHRQLNALRSGVVGGQAGAGMMRRVRVPMLPRLGGVGAVAWMQMTHSLRILPRYMAFTGTIVAVVLLIPMMVDSSAISGLTAVGWQAGLTLYADFLLLLQLPVGFLGPVAQRELLKSLPVSSWRIVIGQLAGPVIPLLILHVAATVVFLYLSPGSTAQILLMAIALIPAGLVITANINLLGAWNIIRPKALQQRDALAAGRAMASVWIFFAMLLPSVLVSVIGALAIGWCWGWQYAPCLVGGAAGCFLSSGLYIGLLANAFHHWQPASHEGGQEEVEHDA